MVRFELEPPNAIRLVGIRLVLVDVAESVSELVDVSTSAMVNGTLPVLLFSLIVRFEMLDIEGKSFVHVTDTYVVTLVM